MADRGRVGSLVVASKSCARKVWRKDHEAHRKRITTVRPATDMSMPNTAKMEHCRVNLKRERLLEDRYTEIDRENNQLLRKMSELLNKPPAYKSEDRSMLPTSLNYTGRKKELQTITKENSRLLKSIQQVQPVYSHVKWEEDYNLSGKHLKNVSAYPVVTRGMARTRSSPSVLMPMPPEMPEAPPAETPAGGDENEGDGGDQKYVLKEGKRLGEAYYLIEFSTDGRILNISAYDGETQSSLELIVQEKKHRQLYREADGDYSIIASWLRIDGDRLLLDRPQAGGGGGTGAAS